MYGVDRFLPLLPQSDFTGLKPTVIVHSSKVKETLWKKYQISVGGKFMLDIHTHVDWVMCWELKDWLMEKKMMNLVWAEVKLVDLLNLAL